MSDITPAKPLAAAPAREVEERPLVAIGLVLLSMAIFSSIDVLSKILVAEYSPIEVAWGRYLSNVLVLVPFVVRSRGRLLVTQRPLSQFVRGVSMLGSAVLFMAGLGQLAIADATSIGFVSPLMVTALSIPILGEKVGIRRWAAVVVGFIGILIIIRPGTSAFNPAALFPVLSAACWSCGLVITRRMKSGEPVLTTLFYTALVGLALLTVLLPTSWSPPSGRAFGLMMLMGLLNTCGQYALVLGYIRGPASMLAPFSYSQIIWSMLSGVFIFGTIPGFFTGVGAAIVVASGLYVFHRERIIKGQAR